MDTDEETKNLARQFLREMARQRRAMSADRMELAGWILAITASHFVYSGEYITAAISAIAAIYWLVTSHFKYHMDYAA